MRTLTAVVLLGLSAAAWAGQFGPGQMPGETQRFTGGEFGPTIPRDSSLIRRGLHFYVTGTGQRYFNTQLDDFFARNGFFLQEGLLEEWNPEKIDSGQFLQSNPTALDFFTQITGSVADVVRARTPILPPVAKFTGKNLTYKFEFEKDGLGVSVDPDEAGEGRPMSYLPLLFSARIRDLDVAAEEISAIDLANPTTVDPIVLTGPHIYMQRSNALKPVVTSPPIVVDVPIRVRILTNGEVDVRVGTPRTNLAKLGVDKKPFVKLVLKYARLRAGIHIGGRVVDGALVGGLKTSLDLQPEEVQSQVESMLLQSAQIFIGNYIEAQLPTILRGVLDRFLGKNVLSQVNLIDPPGATKPVPPKERLQFGVALAGLEVNESGYAHATAGTFFNDPLNPNAPDVPEDLKAKGDPELRTNHAYDVAVSINQGILNRLFELSYLRGVFNNIPIGGNVTEKTKNPGEIEESKEKDEDGNPAAKAISAFNLIDIPVVKIENKDQMARVRAKAEAKLKLPLLARIFGLGFLVKKSSLKFWVDIEARASVDEKTGNVSVSLVNIDPESFRVDPESIRAGAVVNPAITFFVKRALKATNKNLAQKPTVVVKDLPIPKAVLNLPLRPVEVHTEPNGYLTLYLVYDFPVKEAP